VGEQPGVAVGAGVGVRGAAQVETAQAFAQYAGRLAGGGVGHAVVGHLVGADDNRGVGLGDAVADRAAGVVVVAGHVGERPGVAVDAGVGVRRAAQVEAAQAFAQHAGGRAGGGVGR